MQVLITLDNNIDELFLGDAKKRFENEMVGPYITTCRWFSGKTKTVTSLNITEVIPLDDDHHYFMLFVETSFAEGETQQFILPVAYNERESIKNIFFAHPHIVIGSVVTGQNKGFIYDATYDDGFRDVLFSLMGESSLPSGQKGRLQVHQGDLVKKEAGKKLPSRLLGEEQSNTTIVYDDRLSIKLYRRLESGINADYEVIKYLSDETDFKNAPQYAARLEYVDERNTTSVLAFMLGFIPAHTDAWGMMQDDVESMFDVLLRDSGRYSQRLENPDSLTDPELLEIGGTTIIERIRLLGKRTGQLHKALGKPCENCDFKPKPFNEEYQKELFISMSSHLTDSFNQMRACYPLLAEAVQERLELVINEEQTMKKLLMSIIEKPIKTDRIRIHGDYHLGQVLFDGNDFFILDFEGEPARKPEERRLTYPGVKDVAGMIRSFHYCFYSIYFQYIKISPDKKTYLQAWIKKLSDRITNIYLDAYLETTSGSTFVPDDDGAFDVLLQAFILDKAVYELVYELQNRPDWITIPIEGILAIMQEKGI